MTARKPLATPLGLYAYVLAAAVVAVDQLSKWWVLNGLHLGERGQIPVLPFFRLTMVMNNGVSFGQLRAETALGRDLLIGLALLVVIALVAWVRRADRPLFATALGFVIGGAVGNNLIDRPRIGWVIDFLDFSGLMFPWVFNVADSAITVGVVLLLIDSFFGPTPAPRNTADDVPEKAKDKPA
jgi:signal peptidase II